MFLKVVKIGTIAAAVANVFFAGASFAQGHEGVALTLGAIGAASLLWACTVREP